MSIGDRVFLLFLAFFLASLIAPAAWWLRAVNGAAVLLCILATPTPKPGRHR